MAAVQLNFSLRTSSSVKTVHLVGSWDNYSRQLPLSKDSHKSGAWAGKFRFQTSVLQLGGRYWYYYIMDGYHVSHDPAVEYTVEPTTGRKLNVLDVPGGKSSPSYRSSHARRESIDIPKGRALSPSKIQHPKPSKPYASRGLREGTHFPTVDELTDRFSRSQLSDSDSYSSSPPSSAGSSLSSRTDSTSPSSLSSLSDQSNSVCRCERYGITRKGDRVKLDCGGSRCGYLDSSEDSDCSSESESDSEYRAARRGARRQGIVVRR
ncbi:hypothetical protein PISL3812_08611 [Talaromyces islandicus]|uniref:GTP-binding protein EsdC n=1 Tax=Talaromyces islandicus TaxID=28573 RepID=A0A0U1M948_TALIS|nr:hypothetical protein PISL3812_08611 [Talaromyces islandicus]